MKQIYLNKTNASRTLTLFFGGWGSGAELFAECRAKDSDLMLCYDYHDLDFDASVLDGYSSIRVAGWSMGVWAATRLFSEGTFNDLPLDWAAAYGGTVELADDRCGIPTAIFEATVSGMSPLSLKKFRRRMCGAFLPHFEAHLPGRGFDDLDGELKAVAAALAATEAKSKAGEQDRNGSKHTPPKSFWTQAIVGTGDLIFPPANQMCSWERLGVPCREIDAPHYCPEVFEKLIGGESID
ncbi:MAG: pimeloyl-ACP methyl esterase BioG family protein [Candidatus Cryptobacteroides sp.]